MKQLLVIVSSLFVSSFVFAQEKPTQPAQPVQSNMQQPQVVCAEKAVHAAALLFQFNTEQTPTDAKINLIDSAEIEEGGYEVYDVVLVVGDLSSTIYRVTLKLDGCKVISFETPFAD